jgi:hypothetical protein
MARLRIPSPVSGGLLLSYRCSAACRHCMYACSPKWGADWISEEDLQSCLSVLSRRIEPCPWGPDAVSFNHGLHLTGGEPFMNFDLLVRVTEIAHGLGIPSLFVETNGFWARQDEETREKLHLLKSKGLRGILISVNPFYAEYVPFERTERCIRVSLEVFGRNTLVYQIEYYKLFRRLGIRERIALEDFISLTKETSISDRVELFLMGRAAYKLRPFYPAYPARAFFDVPCCPPPIREWHNHFDNYGNVIPGYCSGISLGHWRELDQMVGEGIDMDQHPVLGLLVHDDLRGLLQFAGDFGYGELQEGYISKCHLCGDLRRHLARSGDFSELQPLEFYLRLDE